jgi:hypothetical protein
MTVSRTKGVIDRMRTAIEYGVPTNRCGLQLRLGIEKGNGCPLAHRKVAWTKEHVRDLKAHSKSKTPVVKISKAMKRTPGAIRQKALSLGIAIGHRRDNAPRNPLLG